MHKKVRNLDRQVSSLSSILSFCYDTLWHAHAYEKSAGLLSLGWYRIWTRRGESLRGITRLGRRERNGDAFGLISPPPRLQCTKKRGRMFDTDELGNSDDTNSASWISLSVVVGLVPFPSTSRADDENNRIEVSQISKRARVVVSFTREREDRSDLENDAIRFGKCLIFYANYSETLRNIVVKPTDNERCCGATCRILVRLCVVSNIERNCLLKYYFNYWNISQWQWKIVEITW